MQVTISKNQEQEQRYPEPPGQFAERRPLVRRKHGVAGKESGASCKRRGTITQPELACKCSRRKSRKGEKRTKHCQLHALPGKDGAKRRAEHPRQRRVEDEARFACTPIRTWRPMRVEEAVPPGSL